MPKIHVATPVRGEVRIEHSQYINWLLFSDARSLVHYPTTGYPAADTRNRIVQRFLSDPDAEYLYMVDSDQWPAFGTDDAPFFDALDVTREAYDIIGFPSPTVKYERSDGPLVWLPAPPTDTPCFMPVERMGCGAIIIHRKVLEHPDLQPAFTDLFDEKTGTLVLTEDYVFSMRAHRAGFSLAVAMHRPFAHCKPVNLYAVWRSQIGVAPEKV